MKASFRLSCSALLLFTLAGCDAPQTAELTQKEAPAAVTQADDQHSPVATPAANTMPVRDGISVPVSAENAAQPNPSATTPPHSLRDYQQSLAKACQSDSDCVVKNVGSCCGYQPQCVHKAVQTFPEQVKALCEQEGRSSICGFQEPAGCSCVNHQCRDSAGAGI